MVVTCYNYIPWTHILPHCLWKLYVALYTLDPHTTTLPVAVIRCLVYPGPTYYDIACGSYTLHYIPWTHILPHRLWQLYAALYTLDPHTTTLPVTVIRCIIYPGPTYYHIACNIRCSYIPWNHIACDSYNLQLYTLDPHTTTLPMAVGFSRILQHRK